MQLGNILPLWRIKAARARLPLWRELLSDERRSRLRGQLSWQTRLQAWRLGFLSESFVIYELRHRNPSDYLTDYARVVNSGGINGRYREILADKLLFSQVMTRFASRMPRDVAYIRRGTILWLPGHQNVTIESVCATGAGVVLKPIRGGSGAGITFVASRNGEWYLNHDPTSVETVRKHLSRLDDYLMQEVIEQADYSSRIYSRTNNTIRILTLWDRDADLPFIAAAVHRFGSNASFPVDNWDTGGLSAGIDLQSGALGPAASYPDTGGPGWHDEHPDSRARIKGVRIPNWGDIARGIVEMAAAFPNLPYVGWDVLIDRNDAFKVIEGNHRSGVRVIQVHAPLLRDPRVRRFYQQYGVIRG